ARVAIEDERGAVENELILAADLVDIGERQPGLGHARHRDIHADVDLSPVEWRAVGYNEELGAALREALGNFICPDVFADGHADLDAAEVDRTGKRARVEHALLVEHTVVWQIDFE